MHINPVSLCSVNTPLTLKSTCRKDFLKLRWYYRVVNLSKVRLPGRLLSSKWESVKSRGRPRKPWLAGIESLKKDLDLQTGIVNVKHICKAIESKELKEFELGLQHRSKLHL